MDDVISRKAAIDALKEAFNPSITNFVKAKIAIDKLPSAQPQLPDWAQKVEEYRKNAPSYVQNPLAWALYQVWKEYDERLFNHSRAERRTDDADANS